MKNKIRHSSALNYFCFIKIYPSILSENIGQRELTLWKKKIYI